MTKQRQIIFGFPYGLTLNICELPFSRDFIKDSHVSHLLYNWFQHWNGKFQQIVVNEEEVSLSSYSHSSHEGDY